MPPRQVFDSAFSDPEGLAWGAKFNAVYAATLAKSGRDYEAAREASETYLERWPEEEQGRVLRGAIASAYMNSDREGRPASDAAVWQKGQRDPETGRYGKGVEHRTIRALREIGALDEIGATDEGLIVYPGAVVDQAPLRTLGLRDVWFNLHKAQQAARGIDPPADLKQRDVPKDRRDRVKRQVEHLAASEFREAVLRVEGDEAGNLLAFTETGQLFGKLEHGEGLEPGDSIRLHHARAHDGNLRTTYSRLPPHEGADGED
jgi:hypothetical protein